MGNIEILEFQLYFIIVFGRLGNYIWIGSNYADLSLKIFDEK